MDNRASPDELLSTVLSAPTAKSDLSTVWDCMETYRSNNPLLSDFTEINQVKAIASVLNADDGTAHLVYRDDYQGPAKPRSEIVFDVTGYLISFNLPGQGFPQRLLHRPHSLRQRVMLTADGSEHFNQALQSIKAIKAFIDQFVVDGTTNHSPARTAFGLETIEVHTNLFTHKKDIGLYKERDLPAYMDPTGYIAASIKKRTFCHTTDNIVLYGETDSASDWPVAGNFLLKEWATECGGFRHGQLVKMSVTFHSVRRRASTSKGSIYRNLHIGLKKLTLVGRNAEMSLLTLRVEEMRKNEEDNLEKPRIFKRPAEQEVVPMESKEEYLRRQLSEMSINDDDEGDIEI